MTPNSYEHLCMKIDNLEKHIINLVFPLQDIRNLNSILQRPLQLSSEKVEIVLENIITRIENFFRRIAEIENIVARLERSDHYLDEIQNLLRECKKEIHEIKKEGYRHTLEVHVKDGKEDISMKIPLKKDMKKIKKR